MSLCPLCRALVGRAVADTVAGAVHLTRVSPAVMASSLCFLQLHLMQREIGAAIC